jgi:hypothetical protein
MAGEHGGASLASRCAKIILTGWHCLASARLEAGCERSRPRQKKGKPPEAQASRSPPMPRAEFARLVCEWIDTGAVSPQ